ncbi:hypothetical protein E4U44_004495 [Claviceps purpurea]|nr:hypothetical protein E4U49_007311 [Claviceps purpurea]KAG6311274.1 hypothetical protein E4U44_004495 [Claviceps purpurea]
MKRVFDLACIATVAAGFNLNGFVLGDAQTPITSEIPLSTRNYWIRKANEAVVIHGKTPCPFAAFGSVIVNHTAGGLGQLVCMGANDVASGNPTLHGEIAAINNCSAILTDPHGPFRLTGSEAEQAWADLSLYTNAEPCPMCASAIRWGGFKELVFGTSVTFLEKRGWRQIPLSAGELFRYATSLDTKTTLLKGILSNETDVYFDWQFDASRPCPKGCARGKIDCQPIDN